MGRILWILAAAVAAGMKFAAVMFAPAEKNKGNFAAESRIVKLSGLGILIIAVRVNAAATVFQLPKKLARLIAGTGFLLIAVTVTVVVTD